LAGAVEQKSEHPLAQAVVAAANQQGLLNKYQAHDVRAMIGKGVTGQVNGQTIMVGSHAFFEEHVPHGERVCEQADDAAAAGHTPLLISQNGTYQGYIAVRDTVRDSSRDALDQLKAAGLHHLIMLTGDNQTTAQAIAQEVGVTDVRANLLPEHKVAAVNALQEKFGPVAMLGDGINDAPALATAAVGIAIGAGGTAQALETADIALMQDDLRRLPFAVRLSRATMRTIWANIGLSLAIKAIFLLLVLGGWGTMWLAVLADMGTSLLVTANGLRLLVRDA
jgi:Cd2+/Zn2+-exporting ATPase